MVTLSITLSETLARSSRQLAKKIGLSRTELIRQALAHEMAALKRRLELEEMADSFVAMKKNRDYTVLLEDIEREFSTPLPSEKERWWK